MKTIIENPAQDGIDQAKRDYLEEVLKELKAIILEHYDNEPELCENENGELGTDEIIRLIKEATEVIETWNKYSK